MAQPKTALSKASYRTYTLAWLLLLILLAATVAVAELHLAPGGTMVLASLSVATIKAFLVAIYFMHLRDEPWVLKGMLIFVLFMLMMLILLTFSDEWYRKG